MWSDRSRAPVVATGGAAVVAGGARGSRAAGGASASDAAEVFAATDACHTCDRRNAGQSGSATAGACVRVSADASLGVVVSADGDASSGCGEGVWASVTIVEH